jgi:hypothetical protein
MSDQACNVNVENGYPVTLVLWQYWGSWGSTPPPAQIGPKSSANFTLNDNDRGGVVWLVKDAAGNEYGFVTMSFTCPKSSDNSAEGSPSIPGTFISAGLQPYEEHGSPVQLNYIIVAGNRACWSSGSSNNGKIECPQTSMLTWTQVLVAVNNEKNDYNLSCEGFWNDNWVAGNAPTSVEKYSRRIFLLNDNGRGGIYFRAVDDAGREQGYVTMSLTCPKASSNSAEGSPYQQDVFLSAGLQPYLEHGRPANFLYNVGTPNLACWSNGSADDGPIVCDQTLLNGRAKILIFNNNNYPLFYTGSWADDGDSAWYFGVPPEGDLPSEAHKLLVLSSNDRAGVYYTAGFTPFHMSFTCPKASDNSAEGSPFAGLLPYAENGTPVTFTYDVGQPNQACWGSGSKFIPGPPECQQTKVPNTFPSWMGELRSTVPGAANLALGEAFFPGTHDSACYSMSDGFPYSLYSQTQSLNFLQQLELGVRYFDLRLTWIAQDSFQFYHGYANDSIYSTTLYLDDLLNALATFYNASSDRLNEVVILDFTHFDGKTFTSAARVQNVADAILNSGIAGYLSTRGNYSTTLGTLWTAKTPIIASFGQNKLKLSKPVVGYNTIWNGANLFAPGWAGTTFWPNTSNLSDMEAFLEERLAQQYDGRAWVLQNILTPNTTSGSVESLAKQANPALFENLVPGSPSYAKTNIAILDYFDPDLTIFAECINVARGTAKESLEESKAAAPARGFRPGDRDALPRSRPREAGGRN